MVLVAEAGEWGSGRCEERSLGVRTKVACRGWADVALRPLATSSVCVWTQILI